MESQPNTPRNEECSFDAVETLAICEFIPIAWLLMAVCVH